MPNTDRIKGIRNIIPIYRQRVKKRGVSNPGFLQSFQEIIAIPKQSVKQFATSWLKILISDSHLLPGKGSVLEFQEVFSGKKIPYPRIFGTPIHPPTNALTTGCLRYYMVPWCGGRFYTDKESKGAYVASHHNNATVKSNNLSLSILGRNKLILC